MLVPRSVFAQELFGFACFFAVFETTFFLQKTTAVGPGDNGQLESVQ